MTKLFMLVHNRTLRKELDECDFGHIDSKLIGYFYDEKETKSLVKKYQSLSGFVDFPDGFVITKHIVDSVFNKSTEMVIEPIAESVISNDQVFELYYEFEHEDGHDGSELLAVFSSKQKAEDARKWIESFFNLQVLSGDLEIYENTVGFLGWAKGFFIDNE